MSAGDEGLAVIEEQPIMVEEHVQQSMVSWLIHSAGLLDLLVALSALIVFLGAVILVLTSRRPGMIAAGFAWLLLPLWLGFMGALWGSLQSFMVIAASDIAPKPRELAEGISFALVCPLLGVVLTFPSYLVLGTGLLLRTIGAGRESSS